MFGKLLAGFGVCVALSALAMVALQPRAGAAASDEPRFVLAAGVTLVFLGILFALLERAERLRRASAPLGMWSTRDRR